MNDRSGESCTPKGRDAGGRSSREDETAIGQSRNRRGLIAPSTRDCSRIRRCTSPANPTHNVLGRRGVGNAPVLSSRTSNSVDSPAASLNNGAMSSSRDGSTSPRNFNVRWISDAPTQRTCRRHRDGTWSLSDTRFRRTLDGSSRATKVRQVSSSPVLSARRERWSIV